MYKKRISGSLLYSTGISLQFSGMGGEWEGGPREEGDMCTVMADSLHWMAETNTTL